MNPYIAGYRIRCWQLIQGLGPLLVLKLTFCVMERLLCQANPLIFSVNETFTDGKHDFSLLFHLHTKKQHLLQNTKHSGLSTYIIRQGTFFKTFFTPLPPSLISLMFCGQFHKLIDEI